MMPKQKAIKRQLFFALILLTLISLHATIYGQTTALRLYNNWNINNSYTDTAIAHTTWKPLLYVDTVAAPSNRSWLHRKFFEEHLLSVQQPNYTIYGDIVIDEYIGYDSR